MSEQPKPLDRIRLTPDRLTQLDKDAMRMGSGSAERYLARIQDDLGMGRSPRDAIALLRALSQQGHGKREDERQAIDQVQNWLVGRLNTPWTQETLAAEVGWLRRLSRYYRGRGDTDLSDSTRSLKPAGGNAASVSQAFQPPPRELPAADAKSAAVMIKSGPAAPLTHVARSDKERLTLTQLGKKQNGQALSAQAELIQVSNLPAYDPPRVGDVILAVVDRSVTPFKAVYKSRG